MTRDPFDIPDPRTTLPPVSEWRDCVEELLEDDRLTEWEEEFCTSFLDSTFANPTERMAEIFRRIADKCGVECPDDD